MLVGPAFTSSLVARQVNAISETGPGADKLKSELSAFAASCTYTHLSYSTAMSDSLSGASSSPSSTIINVNPDRPIDTITRLLSTALRNLSPARNQAVDPSTVLQRFTIKDIAKSKKNRIGSGGYGDVYRLSHPQIGDIVLKQLRLSRSASTAEDQRRVNTFLRLLSVKLITPSPESLTRREYMGSNDTSLHPALLRHT